MTFGLDTENKVDALRPSPALEAVRLDSILALRASVATVAAWEEFAAVHSLLLVAAREALGTRARDESCLEISDEYDPAFAGIAAVDPSWGRRCRRRRCEADHAGEEKCQQAWSHLKEGAST